MSEVHPALAKAPSSLASRQEDDLAALISSRICHDLVSPLGAIANGVELLLLSGAPRTPELDLIAESAESANARMRFFRLAFGAASRQAIGRSEITATLRGLERGSRLSFDWQPAGDHPREEIKAVFLLIQCLDAALPLGGQIQVARDGETWEVTAKGPRLRVDATAWAALGTNPTAPPPTAALVQFALLPEVLHGLNRDLALSFEEDRIVVRF